MLRIVHGRLRGAGRLITESWDVAFLRIRRQLGLVGRFIILPYRKFGTVDRLRVAGRVVEDRGVVSAAHTNSTSTNLWLTFKRYAAYELPEAAVRIRYGAEEYTVFSDRKGFFEIELELSIPVRLPAGELWLPINLSLVDEPIGIVAPISAQAFVLIPPASARFGVISDIDDTIVRTGATNFFKQWRTIVANSAEGRVAFRGLAPFYRALQRGAGGAEGNPIFYVSSSPWNLYDLFERFMVLHDIPMGPIILRPIGVGAGYWPGGSHRANKLVQIERIFSSYPQMKFIMIGDSGQHDAEIYTEAALRRPGRVLAIYIRDVTDDKRDRTVQAVLRPAEENGVRCAYGNDLIEAAEDAVLAQWIAASELEEIQAAVTNPDRPGA